MYALVLTATASNLALEVKTANDCADASGIERPASVALVQPE